MDKRSHFKYKMKIVDQCVHRNSDLEINYVLKTVADPGFHRGGANPKGERQPIIWPNLPKTA